MTPGYASSCKNLAQIQLQTKQLAENHGQPYRRPWTDVYWSAQHYWGLFYDRANKMKAVWIVLPLTAQHYSKLIRLGRVDCKWSALSPYFGANPTQVKDEPGSTWHHVSWCYHHGQILCWRCQSACYEQCRGEGSHQINQKVWGCDKINRENVVVLWLGSCKGCTLSGPFCWTGVPWKILGFWFGLDLQLEKNWSEVLEKSWPIPNFGYERGSP